MRAFIALVVVVVLIAALVVLLGNETEILR